jgi:hypothetical protein
MKFMKYKSLLCAFVAGALFVIFVYHAYTVYQVRAITIQNANQIQAIINALNGSATGATSAPVATPTVEASAE